MRDDDVTVREDDATVREDDVRVRDLSSTRLKSCAASRQRS